MLVKHLQLQVLEFLCFKPVLIIADDRAKQSCLEGQAVVTGTEFIPCKR